MKVRRVFGENGKPDRFYADSEEITEAEYQTLCPDKPIGDGSGLIAWKRPVISDALAVHHSQIPAAMARDKAHGLSVEYTPDDGQGGGGRPILTDRDLRKRYIASFKDQDSKLYHDQSGGYGDG